MTVFQSGRVPTLCLRALVVSYLVVLWVDQIFYVSFESSVRLSDILLAIACLTSLLLFPGTALRIARSKPAIWCMAFFASLVVSTLLHEGSAIFDTGTMVVSPFVRIGLQIALLLLFGTVAVHDAHWFGRFAYGFAALVVIVAGVGAIGALLLDAGGIDWAPRYPAFYVRDQHPLFGNWPRPVGGFSAAAEEFGFWAMVAAAVLVAGAAQSLEPKRLILVATSALVAGATLTISASGGLLFLPVLLYSRGYRRAAIGFTAPLVVLLLVAQFPVHLATPPDGVEPGTSSFPCADHSPGILARSESDSLCHLLPGWQGKVLTRYGLARHHAWELWSRSPLLGEGVASFKRQATASRDDSGRPITLAYLSPHSTIAGTAAEQGLVGLTILLAFAFALVLSLRRTTLTLPTQTLAVSLTLVGFASAGISQDAYKERLFWVVCGYAVGLGLRGRGRDRISSPNAEATGWSTGELCLSSGSTTR